jgi:hypothetical protein
LRNIPARAENISVQRNFYNRETVERFERAIISFRIRVDCAEGQPGKQHQQNRNGGRGWRHLHGGAAVTGTPR